MMDVSMSVATSIMVIAVVYDTVYDTVCNPFGFSLDQSLQHQVRLSMLAGQHATCRMLHAYAVMAKTQEETQQTHIASSRPR